MKKIFFLILITVFAVNVLAQIQTFDVVTYDMPQGWEQVQNEGGVQLSIMDKETGEYAVAVITKALPSTASANDNFTNQWASLIKSTVQVNGDPIMEEPAADNGWDIISGGANYTDGGDTGMATLLSATGGGQTVSLVLMTNTKRYQEALLTFLHSLKITAASQGN